MTRATQSVPGALTLSEMKEFASFGSATQRYIRRSLDVGLDRSDAIETWSRDAVEEAGIKVQMKLYKRLADIRKAIPKDCAIDSI
ncbi:MAG: hypothetical protein AAF067_12500, partial [Pseudomonadota bacterium]